MGGIGMKPTDMVTIFVYAMTRNPIIWDVAYKFLPTRFFYDLTDEQERIMAMIFGGEAPTRCPGEQLAWGELMILLWTLAQRNIILDSAKPVEIETQRISLTLEPEKSQFPLKLRT